MHRAHDPSRPHDVPGPGPFTAARRLPTDPTRERRWRRVILVATLLDSAVRIPGTRVRVGLDPILGLIPGVGDSAVTLASLWVVWELRQLGATREQTIRMLGNVALDWIVGLVPVLGDLADVAIRANSRNLRIMGIDPDQYEFDPAALVSALMDSISQAVGRRWPNAARA